MSRQSRPDSRLSSLMIKELLETAEHTSDRGEIPYHETVSSKVYKLIFSQFTVSELKIARLTCKKWHHEIFHLLANKSCFTFKGCNNPPELKEARKLAEFLNVVQRDGFQWKMLRALYPNPEDALPTPVLIQWSHLRIIGSNFLEMKQWITRSHTHNVAFLALKNVSMNWTRYLTIFREFENLERFQDTSDPIKGHSISEVFEKDCSVLDKLEECPELTSLHIPTRDVTFLASKLKSISIQRSRLEEIILFLKIFIKMKCCVMESVELSAQDCLRNSKNYDIINGNAAGIRRKSIRPSEIKSALFAHLGRLLRTNAKTLIKLKLSTVHSTASERFDQYSKHYNDHEANLYKADLRDFIAYINYHRWNGYELEVLNSLTLEFENRKMASVEEVEGFTQFLNSLKSLKTLHVSRFLLTSYNSLSLPLVLKRLGDPGKTKRLCTFAVSLRNEAETQLHLPTNLDLYYPFLSSIIVLCNSQDTDIHPTLFPSKSVSSPVLLDVEKTPELEDSKYSQNSIREFWLVDNRPGRKSSSLLSMKELVNFYPKLTSLIIQDRKHSTMCCADSLIRWSIMDDYGIQLVLETLTALKHLDISGNLVYLTDCGMTGLSPGACERMLKERDFRIQSGDIKGCPFSSLKDLEFCSLQYLGSKVTDVTLSLAFKDMPKLKYLRVFGLIQVTREAKDALRKRSFPIEQGYELVVQSSCL